jgi:hypothetical protein
MEYAYLAAILKWRRVGLKIKRVATGGIGAIKTNKDFRKGEILSIDGKGDFKIVRVLRLIGEREGPYFHHCTTLHVKKIKEV